MKSVKYCTWAAVIAASLPGLRSLAGEDRTATVERLCDTTLPRLDAGLRALAIAESDPGKRLALWAAANVGQPYAASEPAAERTEADANTVGWRLGASDERQFVEQLCALAVAPDLPAATNILRRLRYREGAVALPGLNQNLTADWARNNTWLLEDITSKLGGAMAWIPLHQVVLRRELLLTRYGVEANIPPEKFIGAFVLRAYLYKVWDELQSGDVAIAITGNDRQQTGADIGILVRDAGGALKFVHAIPPAAAIEEFRPFTAAHKEIIGYQFLRFRADAADRATGRQPVD
jgi:hypothetical protein